MNSFEIKYNGNLRTSAKHLESGSIISTDAPKDNHGLGECFSPTDLLISLFEKVLLEPINSSRSKIGIIEATAKALLN